LAAALIPFLMPNKTGLLIFLLGFIFRGIFLSVSNLSLISMLRDLVPQEKLGAFFSRRMRLASGVAVVLSLAAGFFIDWWARISPGQEIYAYSLLFALGFIFGLVAIYYVMSLPETKMPPPEGSFIKIIKKPFQDKEFRNLMTFLGSWNFAINLAAPFFTVYMLKRLGLEMKIVIALAVLSQLVSMLFMEKWGLFADRFSNKAVLKTCAPVFLVCFILWTFTTMPNTHILTIPLLILIHLLMGFSMAGTSLASGNIVLKLAPKGLATPYIAARTMINSIAAGFAPIIGGKFVDYFSLRELSLSVTWQSPLRTITTQAFHFSYWDFFFLLAFVLGYISLRFLRKVNEVGEVEDGIVLKELLSDMRRDLRNFSTIGGLRSMIHFPLIGWRLAQVEKEGKMENSIKT
ncbi:MFS transporter, partial [candidate division CSSED10-310 bacterium]